MDLQDFGQGYGSRLAAWLCARTTLADVQICGWTGLTPTQLDGVKMQGDHHLRVSPINQRLLTWTEIRRCQITTEARLEKRAAYFKGHELSARPLKPELRDVRFHVARMAGVYYPTNGRNAWHSTWVHQYRDGAVSGRLMGAKSRAEGQRTQGSTFYINRIPAVVLQADEVTLVGVEINHGNELRRLSEVFDGPLTAQRVLTAYNAARPNSVIWLHSRGNCRFDDWKPSSASQWRSKSAGPGFWLNWNEYVADRDQGLKLKDVLRRARHSIRLHH